MTSWALLAALGLCCVLSGFAQADPVLGLLGFALFVAGFIAHVIINRIFGIGFSNPQVALGLTAFVLAAIAFVASCIFNPFFSHVDVFVGLAGFSALMACFIAYILINYGIRGSYAMIDRLNARGRGRS